MDPSRWSAVRALAEQAFERPAAERGPFLDQACAGDEALRNAVDRLLEADARSADLTGLVERSRRQALAGGSDALDLTGRTVAGYTLTRLLARGGMGTVYEAEQREPRRRVALKTLTVGLHTPEAVQRFRFESEVLARLSHPAVAQVYETGTLSVGDAGEVCLPWFAMELVQEARDLVTHCREEGLGRDAVVDLFLLVCDAVHHGHLQGVVHRDLKPANLLVGADGRPKVIDFGVARANDAEARAPATRAGHVVGTLQYISPEQLSGAPDAVDSRTDVHALGLVLFELLSGRLPYDVSDRSLAEAARIVCEQAPMPLRQAAPGLPPDLEWITAKALEKQPERRYASAADLAADLRRWRDRQPVQAGPPTTLYRLSRFVARHRVGVVASTLVLLALVAGLAGTLIGLRREATQRRRADASLLQEAEQRRRADASLVLEAEQRRRAEELGAFLGSMFRSITSEGRGPDARVVDVLEDASWRVDQELADTPLLRADVQVALGQAYGDVSMHQRSERLLRAAHASRTAELAPDDPDRLTGAALLAEALARLDRLAEAEQLLLTARADLGPGAADHPALDLWLRVRLGVLLSRQERQLEAEALLLEAQDELAGLRGAGRDLPPLPGGGTLEAQIAAGLHAVYQQLGRRDAVQELIVPDVLALARRQGVEAPPDLAASLAQQGHDPQRIERAEATALLLLTLEQAGRALARDETGARAALHDAWGLGYQFGRFLFECQDDDLAIGLLERVLEAGPGVWGPESVKLDPVLRYLALAHARSGDTDASMAALEESVRLLSRHPGAYTGAKVERMLDMADTHLRRGRADLSRDQLLEALAQDALLPEGDFLRVKMRLSLGIAHTQLGAYDEAERTLVEGHALSLEHLGAGHRMTGWALEFTAWSYEAAGRADEAAAWQARHAAWVPD